MTWHFLLSPRGGRYRPGEGSLGLSWYHRPPAGRPRPCKPRETAGGRGRARGSGLRCALKFARLPQMHTPDIGGQGTTSEAIQDIIRHIRIINGRAVEA